MHEELWPNLKYGVRLLGRSPGFTITATLILTFAIGANTAMFSVIDGVLERALPYRDSERLCVLWKSVPKKNIDWDWTSYPTIQDWRQRSDAFADLAVVLRPEGSMTILQIGRGREKVQAARVSGNFFEVLGVQPLLGRAFSTGKEEGGNGVAVLSYKFWRSRFNGSDSVIGRTVRIDERSIIVIGVMPQSFEFPDKGAKLWLALTADARWPAFQRVRVADAFCAIGRLKPGRTIGQARSEMSAISGHLAKEYPATDAGLGVRIVPLVDQIAGSQVRRALWTLGAAVACVLLIACSNIGSLLVARCVGRRQELALRSALGAGRGRLLWQLASENIVLSIAGAAGGVLLAYAGLPSLLALAPPDLPRLDEIAVNGTALAFTFCVCLFTAMIFAVLPARGIVKADPNASLREGSRTTSSGPQADRMRGLLVAVQFALTIVLLSGAALLIHSFVLLNAVRPGFDTTHLLTSSVELSGEKYEHGRATLFFDRAIANIEALPGVRRAAAGSALFESLKDHVPNQNIVIEGRAPSPDIERHGRNIVSEEYFAVLGIPLRRGRLFSSHDVAAGQPVAVINETMARHFWPGENPVGKRFKEVLPGMNAEWKTVVGVAGDVLYNRDGIVFPVFYEPVRQSSMSNFDMVIRTEGDPLALAKAVRRVVRNVEPALPYLEMETVEDRLRELDRPRQFQTELLGIFAAAALLLSAAGLYGLVAYSAAQRRKEIGIRIAMGATPLGIARLVLWHGLAWGLGGMLAGIAGALALRRILSASLYGIPGMDPLTLGVVAAILALVVAAAAAVPTFDASRVDPCEVLRQE